MADHADDSTHAGHPCNADRWCVNDRCNAAALAAQAILRGDDELNIFKGLP